MGICTCGHVDDEHGDDEHGEDPDYPGYTACNVDDCDCIAYEEDESEDEL